MKKIISVLLLVVICLQITACSGGVLVYKEREFFVMDTVFTLRIYGADDTSEQHFAAVLALLGEIDAALSKTKESSDVSRINRERAAGELSHHTEQVLTVAMEVMKKSDGAYLPTLGQVTAMWEAAGQSDTLPNASDLEAALADARLGFSFENGVCALLGESALLDLGGIGKGYAADCVLAYLREQRVQGALLSFGSSVATIGEKGDGSAFRIALRHPRKNASVGVLTDPVGVLSVSGDYERYVTVNGARYHHILNPATGYPTDSGLASVAVLCESGAYSDAISTACMVLGKTDAIALCERLSAAAVLISTDGDVITTGALQFSAS